MRLMIGNNITLRCEFCNTPLTVYESENEGPVPAEDALKLLRVFVHITDEQLMTEEDHVAYAISIIKTTSGLIRNAFMEFWEHECPDDDNLDGNLRNQAFREDYHDNK